MNNFEPNNKLLEDIHKIKISLGYQCTGIAVFGSTVKCGLHQAYDIDVAIFMKNPSTEYIINKLSDVDLNYAFNHKNVAYNYGGGGGMKANSKTNKEFDMVVLNSINPDKAFMDINKNTLQYIC